MKIQGFKVYDVAFKPAKDSPTTEVKQQMFLAKKKREALKMGKRFFGPGLYEAQRVKVKKGPYDVIPRFYPTPNEKE